MSPCDAAATAASWGLAVQTVGLAMTSVASGAGAFFAAVSARHARASSANIAVVRQQTNGMLHGLATQHADAVAALREIRQREDIA